MIGDNPRNSFLRAYPWCIVFLLFQVGVGSAEPVKIPYLSTPSAWSWWVSDSLGTPLQTCSWYDQASFPWTLAVRDVGQEKWETLWKGRKEQRVIRRVYDRNHQETEVDTYLSHEVFEVRLYDPTSHHLTELQEYRQGQETLQHKLLWEGNRLKGQTVTTPQGRFLYEDTLTYAPDGRLRRLVRRALDGVILGYTVWTNGDSGPIADTELFQGRSIQRVDLGKTLLETDTDASGQSQEKIWTTTTQGQTETQTVNGQQRVKEYDTSGRLTRETLELPDKTQRVKTWIYDQQGRLILQTQQVHDILDEIKTEWTPTGKVVTTWKDGVLQSQTVWKGSDIQKEVQYLQGTKIWEKLWENGRTVETLFYLDGNLVRTLKDSP